MNATYQKTQEAILGDEETKAMVEKWKGHQEVFMDYVLRPCCLHVLYEDRVMSLNVWSGRLDNPVKKKAVKQAFVVGGSASSGAAAEHLGDWTMAE